MITWHKLKAEMEDHEGDLSQQTDVTQTLVNILIEIIAKLTNKFFKICNKLFANDNLLVKNSPFENFKRVADDVLVDNAAFLGERA